MNFRRCVALTLVRGVKVLSFSVLVAGIVAFSLWLTMGFRILETSTDEMVATCAAPMLVAYLLFRTLGVLVPEVPTSQAAKRTVKRSDGLMVGAVLCALASLICVLTIPAYWFLGLTGSIPPAGWLGMLFLASTAAFALVRFVLDSSGSLWTVSQRLAESWVGLVSGIVSLPAVIVLHDHEQSGGPVAYVCRIPGADRVTVSRFGRDIEHHGSVATEMRPPTASPRPDTARVKETGGSVIAEMRR